MSNDEFLNLPICETSSVVLLKPNQPHPCYYGPVRTTRKRGDYSAERAEYWFIYQNTPRRCVDGQSGFVEV